MDVGMINERPFLNVAGAGFDAQVGLDFHEHGRRGGRRAARAAVRRAPVSPVPDWWLPSPATRSRSAQRADHLRAPRDARGRSKFQQKPRNLSGSRKADDVEPLHIGAGGLERPARPPDHCG